MHPPLNCNSIVPFPTQDIVSPPFSLSNDSSTRGPLKVQQLFRTRQNTHTAACEDAASVQSKFPVKDAAVLLPCAYEEAEGLQAENEDLPPSTGHFYGARSQIRVEGPASTPTRQPQQLRHPPENWTGQISQEICFHHEETSTRRTSYSGSDGKLVRGQTSEEFVQEQGVCRRRHQGAFESEKKKVKGLLVTQDVRVTAEAAVKAAAANQVNPFPYLSYTHAERAARYTHRTQGLADTEVCKSNLLRSLSADITEQTHFAQTSGSHSREGQLGIAGTQKPRGKDFWTATGSVCKSPSCVEKPPQLAEKNRFIPRAVPSVKDAKRKGEREKKVQDTNLMCEEQQKCAPDRKVLLKNCFAEGAPFQNEHSFPARKNSLQRCQAQWRVRSGQSPVAFSSTKPEQTITRPASPSLEFPGAAELPRRAESYCSHAHLLSWNLESKPHILVRSYRTFQQECCSLGKPDGFAEAKAQQNIRRISAEEQVQTASGDACLRANFESSSSGSRCEGASRGIQKQTSSVAGHSPTFLLVSNTQPLSEERRNHAEKKGPNDEHGPAGDEHLSACRGRGTASRISWRNPQEPQEGIGASEDIHPVLPHRLLLKRLLGSGAMGHVYLVELDERPYAVKIALQSDPAACMYLKQGWRNLVHLEKIYQRRQRQAAKQRKRPTANCSYPTDTEHMDVLRYASPSTTPQKAAQVRGRQYPNSGRTTAVQGHPDPHQTNAKDGRKGKHSTERGLLGRRREKLRKEPDIRLSEKILFQTIRAEESGTQHDDVQESMSLHPNCRGTREIMSQESKEAIAEEEMPESLKSVKYRKNTLPVPPPDSAEISNVRQIFDVYRKPGENYLEKLSPNSGEVANCGKIVEADKRDRYFCRPIAFIEGEWFRFEAPEQEITAAPVAAAKLTDTRLLRLHKTSVGQKLPARELLAQQATAREGTPPYFASHSSLTSSPLRNHKQGCQAAGEQAVTCGPPRVPVCAYIMEYIPDACQLTAVIWNLHRCLDPSHALRRECHSSLVGQRLVEIGLCVAEAHKYIAAEAGLYSFDFNPKNILVCVLPGDKRDISPRAAASSTKKVILPSDSSASPPAAGRVMRTGTRAGRRQKEEVKTLCNAGPLRCVSPHAQQQLQQQREGQQQQQHKQLHMPQQHAHQRKTREQQGHTNLSPADITRLVLCDPRVQFRVVAIDLDCSLQAPFTSSAGSSAAADVVSSSTSSSLSQTEDVLGPLLDWSCGRRVVYSCPHVSSITAAYIVAVLAKNKGEGQFTRSGLSEAAAHASLCCRIDSKDNFLHYLWAPSGKAKGTSKDAEANEQVKTQLEEKECVSKMDATKTFPSHLCDAEQPTVRISYSSEHVSREVDHQQLEASSSRTQAKETSAAQQGDHGLVVVESELSILPNSCIPAEVSTPTDAPAQKRPAPAATELRYCPPLRAYPASCTSLTKHKTPSPSSAVPSRGDSSPKLISASNEQLAAGGSSHNTEERTTCLKPQMLHLADSSKRSCRGQLTGTMQEMVDGSAGASTNKCSSNTRGKNKEGIGPCMEAGDKRATVWRGLMRGDKVHTDTKKDVLEACSCSCTLHASNIAAPRSLAASTGQPSMCVQQQLHLPCFLYPRWEAKTPRGICQREYSNYGVRLAGQHVNLQLLSFILCELLDFRSLHVVVLQRFGLELRALHLPTGICQMFSEQDQIISCLCFSALTRMTSAVVPPLRFFSLATAKRPPTSMLHLFPPEPFCLTQQYSVVPLPLDRKAPVAVCACQQILKLQQDSKDFGSSQHGKANGTDEQRGERGDAVIANKARHHALSRNEKCSIAGPAAHEVLLKDSVLFSSAGNCPAVLLLQKQNTEGGILLLPGAAAEGHSRTSLQKGCTGTNDSQNVSTTTKANSVNSDSFAATTWRTCMEQQVRRDILNSGKGECQCCIQEGSPRREAGKKEAGQEGDGDTHAVQNHPRNHSSLHLGSTPLCMHSRRNDHLSWHEQLSQSHHLSSLASYYTTPITASQRKVRLAARESTAAGTATGLDTVGASRAVVQALAAKTGLCLKQMDQQSPNLESLRSVLGAGERPEACILSPVGTQQHQEKWMKTGMKTQWQQGVNWLTEGSPFGAYIGSQHPDGAMHSYAAEMQEAGKISEKARSRTGLACPAPLAMLRHHQQLQQEQAQQEQQQKVRRLMPEDVSRMSVWDKVEQLPALNPHDFLPPLHLFGTSCMQEVAALNAVLLQFLDPHPFFALQYSSSTSAFDSIIRALRQLRCRLVSLREDTYS